MPKINIIATTISGSISDWRKVEQIVPLFNKHGFPDVEICEVGSHEDARTASCQSIKKGGRIIISAGGSGTFRAVLEGCVDSQVDLADIRLGFLRKGSADLIGKVLHMPDDIDQAIEVFAEAISKDAYLPADILQAASHGTNEKERHFIGYGGAELFGRIPHYTENRHIKYYKGILGQIFGDLGPFTTGMFLSLVEKFARSPFRRKKYWRIFADGTLAAEGFYQAIIVVNGYLGPDLPFSDKPLDSKEFYLFGLKDLGALKLFSQARQSLNGAIMDDPARWGLEAISARNEIELIPDSDEPFPVNVDGSSFQAIKSMTFKRSGQIPLIKNCRK